MGTVCTVLSLSAVLTYESRDGGEGRLNLVAAVATTGGITS